MAARRATSCMCAHHSPSSVNICTNGRSLAQPSVCQSLSRVPICTDGHLAISAPIIQLCPHQHGWPLCHCVLLHVPITLSLFQHAATRPVCHVCGITQSLDTASQPSVRSTQSFHIQCMDHLVPEHSPQLTIHNCSAHQRMKTSPYLK
jgi:hypothetical protein